MGREPVVEAGGGESASAERPSPAETVRLWRVSTPGPRARRSGPLVYVPGLGPSPTGRTSMQRLLQRVGTAGLARTFDVWLPARRGSLSAGTTIAELAAEHARAIRSRFDRPVDVIGESTGGSIALRLALDHPDVVRRLVLVSAASRLGDQGREVQGEIARALRIGSPRRAAALLLGTTTTRPGRRALLRLAGRALGGAALGPAGDLIRLIEAEDAFDVSSELHRVSAPTLLIAGARDGYYSPDRFRTTAAGIAGSTYLEHPGLGHRTALTSRTIRRRIDAHLRAGV